ncbi:MAG: DUF5723 family protein [Ignavibacteria bacterium]|nr:DUF5723 family protein [Ignavibacteria bacterium]
MIIIALLFTVMTVNSQTGLRSDARTTSMGFATVASSEGINAYGINPANFANGEGDRKWEISVLSLGGGYGSDSSIGFYNNYLKYLSVNRTTFANLFTDLNSVLEFRQNVLPSEKTDVNYDFELRWFSVNITLPKAGSFNITVADKVGLNTEVNSRDEYLPLTFGFFINKNGSYNLTDVKLSQSEAIAWWIRKYSLGYARKFPLGKLTELSFGFSSSLVHGFGNVTTYSSSLQISTWGVQRINGVNHIDSVKGKQNFHTQSALTDYFRDYRDGADEKFNLLPKPAGIGWGLDLGMNFRAGDFRLGAGITDIGKINWNYNTVINNDTDSFAYYDFSVRPEDPVYNRFVNDLGGFTERDTISPFSSSLPLKFRSSVAYRVDKRLLVEISWTKGFNRLPGNTDKNIFAVAAEYFPFDFLALRNSLTVGGPGDFYISSGAGLKFRNFEFDIGSYGINHLLGNKRFSFSLSTKLILK